MAGVQSEAALRKISERQPYYAKCLLGLDAPVVGAPGFGTGYLTMGPVLLAVQIVKTSQAV